MKKNSIYLRKKNGIPYSALLTKKLTVLFVFLHFFLLKGIRNLNIAFPVEWM